MSQTEPLRVPSWAVLQAISGLPLSLARGAHRWEVAEIKGRAPAALNGTATIFVPRVPRISRGAIMDEIQRAIDKKRRALRASSAEFFGEDVNDTVEMLIRAVRRAFGDLTNKTDRTKFFAALDILPRCKIRWRTALPSSYREGAPNLNRKERTRRAAHANLYKSPSMRQIDWQSLPSGRSYALRSARALAVRSAFFERGGIARARRRDGKILPFPHEPRWSCASR